ncbi:MAG: 4-(cytidine 5'-diphospho)-2-C-methyl-D-erythritol kinase [Candidatus Dadabacteria bacterium]|nr:4-(cytidine 5'-diphospho)-2-C-methyl-D-erythritol kinase [Candidatus Dadabacteria bacterium]
MSSITLLSPAKINLTLEVLGVRTDGYHEIRSIIQPIDLFDEVSIDVEEGEGIEIESSGVSIPTGKDNLAWRAAELFLQKSGINRKINIFIRKRIPLGAGLGGGSSNAAAVLTGLNRITNALSEDDLYKIAPKIGADVPFFIRSLTASMEGIGEKLSIIKEFPIFHYVILCPNLHTSTPEVYKKWDELNLADQNNIAHAEYNLEGCIKKFIDKNGDLPLQNDLEGPAISVHPEIASYKKMLTSLDIKSVLMTGSGSAVYAVFRSEEEAFEMYEYLKTSPTFQVFLASGIKGWHRLI